MVERGEGEERGLGVRVTVFFLFFPSICSNAFLFFLDLRN